MNKAKYTKKEFEEAYKWMFAESPTKSAKVYKNASEEYIESVVETYRNNFKKSFYTD